MAGKPQRSGRWSLRQVSLAAGVSLATARSVVRSGHLDSSALTERDVLVLRVAAMLPALQPLGELRPANATREVPEREREAIRLVRELGEEIPQIATLIITAHTAAIADTFAAVSASTLEAASAGEPILTLPVGAWAHEISAGNQEAA